MYPLRVVHMHDHYTYSGSSATRYYIIFILYYIYIIIYLCIFHIILYFHYIIHRSSGSPAVNGLGNWGCICGGTGWAQVGEPPWVCNRALSLVSWVRKPYFWWTREAPSAAWSLPIMSRCVLFVMDLLNLAWFRHLLRCFSVSVLSYPSGSLQLSIWLGTYL